MTSPAQVPMDIDVNQAARQRIRHILSLCDGAYVAFSGGKDSGVLLNLVLEEAGERQVGVMHLDYEAQYSQTTEYVDSVFDSLPASAVPYRVCAPLRCPTSTSMHEDHWRPWEPSKRDIWVRDMPSNAATDFPFITESMSDYEFQEAFAPWYAKQHECKRVAVFVGIRAQESLDRWRTIVSTKNRQHFEGLPWTTVRGNAVQSYPIYDWKTEDVWHANAANSWDYNKLYDLFNLSGVPLHAQRVASPFHDAAKSSLALYKAIDPKTWGRMVSRVNGVNCTALYGGTTMMGWKNITKPDHLSWREYALFLIETLPEPTQSSFKQKLETSLKFWAEKGGCLSDDAIRDIEASGIQWREGVKTARRTEKRPVRMSYADDVDSKEFQSIPTWKRICVCILKNDHVGKYMGFGLNKTEMQRRKQALEKYRDL